MSTWINAEKRKPKPGVNVLIVQQFRNQPQIRLGCWIPKWHTEDPGGSPDAWHDYHRENNKYYLPEGWYFADDDGIQWPHDSITHWMPLPKLPKVVK